MKLRNQSAVLALVSVRHSTEKTKTAASAAVFRFPEDVRGLYVPLIDAILRAGCS